MGLNLVMACHCHRVRRFVYRGHEDGGIVDFYRQHWQCNVNNPGTVVLSDDQASDSWLHDESYEQEEYGRTRTP